MEFLKFICTVGLTMVSGLIFMFAWKVDPSQISFVRFLISWIIGAIILIKLETIVKFLTEI